MIEAKSVIRKLMTFIALLRVFNTAKHLCSGFGVQSVVVKMFEEVLSTVTNDRLVAGILLEFETAFSSIHQLERRCG